ncbi:toprim domain-containing protein [Paenibacillus sp. 1P07SE]|uniref:toprim domain-containing protein n=1 Tax=Paenibacillus sp. 1P07SE TaxID=3132209 RepID=UPI0039A442A0
MRIAIIVEGKNDRRRLQQIVTEEVAIHCSYGTPGTEQIERLLRQTEDREVYLFMDNDSSGKRIRGKLRDAFPDAEHIYTRRGYPGVEGTPVEYLVEQLEKAGLGEYIVYPDAGPAPRWSKEDQI